MDLLSRTRAAVWHPCTQMKQLDADPPLAVARGEGPWLIGVDGRLYLDAISSWWVNLFGHCNPRINAAITDQLGRLEHVMLAGATHAPVVELSERLAQLTGLGHAFYGSDGASATEIALKMSAHYWRNQGRPGKNGFISLQNGYHGETVGALSVTDIPLFKATYAPLLRHTVQVPTPDARLAEPGESAEAYALRCAAALEAHLAEHADTTAAFIVEPLVQGAAGMAMYPPVYLTRARELCDQYDVHLIADEIAVGFGRTGTMFACEQASLPSPPGRGAGGEGAGAGGEGADGGSRGARRHPDIPPEYIEFARKLRHEQTDAESVLWYLLRDRRLAGYKFRRQHPMPPYTLDFYCHEASLAIELDGGQHAESVRDARRDAWLAQQGLRVVRFWNNQVLQETEAVLSAIWAALPAGERPHPQTLGPHPQPLSPGERGEGPVQAGVKPDFICLSKGLTGGYLPLSAVLTTDAVYAAFYDDETARGFLHSHSYTGNPLACRAALAVLDIFEQDRVIAANRIKAETFTGILAEVAAHKRVRHFRHLGMIWAFDVADAKPGFAARFHRAALAKGVFIRPIGATVYVMPPYVVDADAMRDLAAALRACLDDPAV
ncbi:MAG: aminotransferase class III-fold pyridoxal phosphate-dependent enzyme [Pseudomonadota bacterium]